MDTSKRLACGMFMTLATSKRGITVKYGLSGGQNTRS